MTAFAAPLDVTAERCGAATLDRDHGAPPRGGQRRTMLVTESRPEVAEHVRHFQPLAGHGTSAVRRARGPARLAVATCEASSGLAVAQTLLVAITQITSRGVQTAMTEQQLDGTQIGAGLQQVNGEGVAQGMRRDRFADAAIADASPGRRSRRRTP